MIRHGRAAVDVHGVADLHELAYNTARKYGLFTEPDLPEPVNAAVASTGRGGRKPLWDRDQVAAHATGARIPALPTAEHAQDLLEAPEAAALLGIRTERFATAVLDGKLPEPDVVVCGVKHWRRATVAAMEPGRPRWPNRRPTMDEAGELRTCLETALRGMEVPSGGRVNVSELARRAEVARPTAQRFLDDLSDVPRGKESRQPGINR